MKIHFRKYNFLIIILLVAAVLSLNFFKKEVKSFFYFVSAPVQKVLWEAGDNISDFFGNIFSIDDLKTENENLKIQNQELLAQIALLESLRQENETLNAAVGIGLEKEFTISSARVISKDINQDTILIDKGSEDGLSLNLPAITEQKNLVGKISEVFNHYSKVMLTTNSDMSFDAVIFNTQTYGIVKGEGHLEADFEFVPREAEMKEGDLIFTTSLGDIFPNNLFVGSIKEVERNDIESFQSASLQPAFDINDLSNLIIIVKF
ncbi:MAG: rod shape-determining protein MreC [Patescibacteria group bacterium]